MLFFRPRQDCLCAFGAAQPSVQWRDVIAVDDPGGEEQHRHLYQEIGQWFLVNAKGLAQAFGQEIDAVLEQVHFGTHLRQEAQRLEAQKSRQRSRAIAGHDKGREKHDDGGCRSAKGAVAMGMDHVFAHAVQHQEQHYGGNFGQGARECGEAGL